MSQSQVTLCEKELRGLFTKATKETGWKAPNNFPKRIEGPFFPDSENIFKAFELIAPEEVNYVILGQDPYFNVDEKTKRPYAIGLAFDVPDNCGSLPPSLLMLAECLEIKTEPQDRLLKEFRDWRSDNKILMLNAALTVIQDKPGSHKTIWRKFVREILDQVNGSATFIAWGALAHNLMSHGLQTNRKVKGYCYHPKARDGGKSFKYFWKHGIGAKLFGLRRKLGQT